MSIESRVQSPENKFFGSVKVFNNSDKKLSLEKTSIYLLQFRQKRTGSRPTPNLPKAILSKSGTCMKNEWHYSPDGR
jgi:hypothetical protein